MVMVILPVPDGPTTPWMLIMVGDTVPGLGKAPAVLVVLVITLLGGELSTWVPEDTPVRVMVAERVLVWV